MDALAGPSDQLEARRVRWDFPAHGDSAASGAAATADRQHRPESFAGLDRVTTLQDPSGRPGEIRLDRSQRLSVSAGSRNFPEIPLAVVVGALAASLGLGWIFGATPSSFDWSWVGRLSGNRSPAPQAASPSPATPGAGASVSVSSPSKGDRLPIHHTIIRETVRRAPAKSADSRDLFSSTAMTRWKSSLAGVPPAPPAGQHAGAGQPHPASTAVGPAKPRVEAPLTPVPDTRPTTIDGWTIREVANGTAVLQGPGGTWRAARGDTVPGVGRVVAIFRWGNRLMVATSKGLISTP